MASYEFVKLVSDFTADLFRTFPEYEEKASNELMHTGYIDCIEYQAVGDASANFSDSIQELYNEISETFPKHFFDILYKNEEALFEENITLLPTIDLKYIWSQDLSEQTRDVIWNHLYLFLFTTLDQSNASSFGDTAKLFEAIDHDTLKSKLEETIGKMQQSFSDMSVNDVSSNSDFKAEDIPDADEVQKQVEAMMEGKIGKLAKEIAEETAGELDIDFDKATDMNQIFKKLFQNPQKLMSMMQNVGKKLDRKMKEGDFKESELMEEAQTMMEQMKGMPGMKNLSKMMGKNGFPDLGKMGNMPSMNAMQSHLKNNMRMAKQKERMASKLRERRRAPPLATELRETNFKTMEQDGVNTKFTVGEGAAEYRTARKTGDFDDTAKQVIQSKPKGKGKKKRKNKKK